MMNSKKFLELAQQARENLSHHLKPTPLAYSVPTSEKTELNVWLKMENLLPSGSFKARPAFNGILSNLEQAMESGVVACSSGNFAQAVAKAATTVGVESKIVMMKKTSPYKIKRTRDFGGDVVLCENDFDERTKQTEKIQKESGRLLLHPFDSIETLAGDATIALELMDQLEKPATILVPVGGAGLVASISRTLKETNPEYEVIGIQPTRNKSLAKSLKKKELVNVGPVETIADGLIASEPGKLPFEICQKYLDNMVHVEEDDIRVAFTYMFEELKIMVEPSAAVTLAALFSERVQPQHNDVICILTGSNFDPKQMDSLLSAVL